MSGLRCGEKFARLHELPAAEGVQEKAYRGDCLLLCCCGKIFCAIFVIKKKNTISLRSSVNFRIWLLSEVYLFLYLLKKLTHETAVFFLKLQLLRELLYFPTLENVAFQLYCCRFYSAVGLEMHNFRKLTKLHISTKYFYPLKL